MSVKQKHDELAALLQGAGVRPTRQRLALAAWLFDGHDKHVTAEQVHDAALKMRAHVSLATVYNTLNNFTTAGLLRQVVIDGGQIYFDTNTGDHYHIFDEEGGYLTDIPAASVPIARLPKLPQGKSLSRIDVVLRVRTSS
ncbi:MAG: transcriptional repressor [Alphaproteobacteria bacterium]|nr:transcriptional repressor [Alphaproteobacteria bacterium]